MSDLLPCPFCGEAPSIMSVGMAGQPRWQHPVNDTCPIAGHYLGGWDFPVQWNQRALPAVQPDADKLVGHMTKLIAAGLDRIEQLTAERDKYESAWMTAEGKLADAMEGLEKCQAELDEYSRQEYPLDHTVHERYRQRDYDANPARITLAALKGESHD